MVKIVGRIAYGMLFLFYFVETLLVNDFWGFILSPILVLIATYSIFKDYGFKAENKKLRNLGFILGFSTFAWAISDIILAFDYFSKLNSDLLFTIADYIYGLTNIFMFIVVSVFVLNKIKKLDIAQALINVILVTIVMWVLIWVIFFDSSIEKFFMLKVSWYDSILLLINFLIFIEVSVYLVSIRRKRIPLNFLIFPLGMGIFVVSDMIYYYQFFFSEYIINSVLDSIYVLGFIIISLGMTGGKNNYNDDSLPESKNALHNGYWAISFPILIIIFDGLNFRALFIVSAIVAVFFLVSSYIQKNTYQKELLVMQEILTKELEAKVEERTRELTYTLNTDSFTGLYNSRYFLSQIDKEINGLKNDETILLFYVEMDRYRSVKMIYGDSISSQLLKFVSERLKRLIEKYENSILASYEQGVFLISQKGICDYKTGLELAKKIIEVCSDIYLVDEYNIKACINIGISLYPVDSHSKDELIKNANLAMAHSRLHGDNESLTFEKQLGEFIYYRTRIAIELKKINYDEEFFLNFQPQVSINDGKVIAFEALLRWKTKEGKMIPPGDFIPIAEESGSIIAIGDWVITQALKQLMKWRHSKKEPIRMAINVSAKQLGGRFFLDKLKAEMERFDIPSELIELEITESVQLENNPETVEILEKIRALGISIAIDDFGTGYSSLYYFKNLPTDRIKISKPLIDKIDKEAFEYSVVKAVIELGKVKGVKVIAEGVETKEQWECLNQLGCDEVQGYYFGRPVSADEAYERR